MSSSKINLALAARRIVFRRMDGTMSVTQRDKAIQDFQERADVNVLIVSLKAAALGLNLVAANHVVLLDLVRRLLLRAPCVAPVFPMLHSCWRCHTW